MKLTELAYSLKWFFSGLQDRPVKALKKLRVHGKVRLIVVCSTVLLVAVTLVTALTVRITLNADAEKNTRYSFFSFDPLAPEDFFLSEEPEFLPPVMLEQERKDAWSVEDASEFWTAPSEFSGEFWREEVSASIDRLLEPLP
ncbi:MAG: hypothetical protein LBD86_06280 [Spirochaetaceae bacterium]|jgi:hypothetical protein|nr:hypothetical protein [Spirochaetaceae bacterium]